MSTSTTTWARIDGRAILGWTPVVLLPVGAWLALTASGSWRLMWGLSLAVFIGLKWLTWIYRDEASMSGRDVGYLLLWPGLDADAFMAKRSAKHPSMSEIAFAITKTILGVGLLGCGAKFADSAPLIGAWIGMAGVVVSLHFGLFHVLSCCWRRVGVQATPIMNAPILATSLSDFWSNRWNLAFRDVARKFVFKPAASRYGAKWGMLAVFLASGLVHDLVISVSAGAGYGLPTVYFLIQGAGVLFERNVLRGLQGTKYQWINRLFTAAIVLAPVGLLFHSAFAHKVVVPMLVELRDGFAASLHLLGG